MGAYLERYLRGECEAVWDELVALGAGVREEPLHSDALAVARETMRRARANIETLIPRLRELGYEFGYGWAVRRGSLTDEEAQGDVVLHAPVEESGERIAAMDGLVCLAGPS